MAALAERMACPACRAGYRWEPLPAAGECATSGWLNCDGCSCSVPVIRGFPIFEYAELDALQDPARRIAELEQKLFCSAAEYVQFLRGKERRPAPDVYAAYQPFNEATRIIDPLLALVREQLSPGDLILDLWCRTGWTGDVLAGYFPEQQVVSLWEGGTDVLGYRGFDFWHGESLRKKNWDIVFCSAGDALPFASNSAAMVFGFDVLHHYAPVPFMSEVFRVADEHAPLLFPHVHLTNSEPEPFFERGEIQRHGAHYQAYFDKQLEGTGRQAFILSEEAYYAQDSARLHSDPDMRHYNACVFVSASRHDAELVERPHDALPGDRVVINPLLQEDPMKRSLRYSADSLFGRAGALMDRHPMTRDYLQTLGSVELSVEERKVLLLAGDGLSVEQMEVAQAVVEGMSRRQLIRALPVSEGNARLRAYFSSQRYHASLAERSLQHLWRSALQAHPQRVLLRWPEDGDVYTYQEIDLAVQMAVAMLQSHGLVPGDRLVLRAEQHPEFLMVFWAAVQMGIVVVPVDPGWRAEQVASIIRRCNARLYLDFRTSGDTAYECPAVVLGDGSVIGSYAPATVSHTVGPRDPAVILFTSGTTGVPKGVVLPHESLYSSSLSMTRQYAIDGADEVLLFTGGLHTMSGLRNTCVLPVIGGVSTVFYDFANSSPVQVLQLCRREKVTLLSTAPGFIEYLNQASDKLAAQLARTPLRLVLSTGSRLTPAQRADFEQAFSLPLRDYYGLTETGGACVYGTEGEGIGRPIDCLATVFGPDGQEVPPGEQGELGIFSRNLMLGYLDGPGGQEARYAQGHLLTGDLVRMQASGEIEYLGRRDSLVSLPSGENVALDALERDVLALAGVAECHVARCADAEGRDQVTLYIVPAPGVEATSRRWRESLAQCNPGFDVVTLDGLPRLPSGDVDVAELAATATHS